MASRSIKNRPGVKKKRSIAGVLSVVAILLALCGSGTYAAYALVNSWFEDLPDYKSPDAFVTSLPTYVYASDGTTVLARFQLEYREPVELNQISPNLVNAILSIEDARFYEHAGVDFMGVLRAFVNNLTGGQLEGASTITQQYVRNTVLADEMDNITIKRKAREAYVAVEMEKMYSKDDILNMYLNTINFGAGAFGAEAAAQRYFSKHASELTIAESALIAGVPQSPTYNNPIQFPENALARRNIVLKRMLDEHYITEAQYNLALSQPLGLNPKELDDDGILAYPYFTSYIRYQLYNDFDLSETDILKGGLKVYTTLDVDAQNAAEAACAQKRAFMGNDRMEVAMAVVDPQTGNVQALVGGSDYKKSQVNLATGEGGYGRPCGSVFKTFTLVTAINKSIDPNNTYLDCNSPATVDGYKLENFSNTSYGIRNIASAFAVSSNTGFVRLISSIGVYDVADMAHAMGITSDLYPDSAGSALTLGVQNVTPLELANAVGTIADNGVHHDLCSVLIIKDHDDNVLVDNSDASLRANRVFSEEVAHATQEAMKGVIRSGTGTAAALPNGQPVGGKTGTSEDYKDISFVGITPHIAAAVWVGDPTNEVAAATGACADVFSWYAYAYMAAKGMAAEDWPYADAPYYAPYDDQQHQVYSASTYQYMQEQQRKKEEEERKRQEAEKKKQQEAEKKKQQEAEKKKQT